MPTDEDETAEQTGDNQMGTTLRRPESSFDPKKGLLRNEHFQVAWATNDIERARALLRDRYGIPGYRQLKGELPSGGHIHIELAWVGTTMYELVTASGPGSDVFMQDLPEGDDFAMRFHHLGFVVGDRAGWEELQRWISEGDFPVRSANHTEGFMRTCIIEAPELGHCLEFFLLEEAGLEFLENVPAN